MPFPLLAGIATLAGAGANALSQESANTTNVELFRADWKRKMEAANTQYQRGVQDMRKAGLNPMLAYSQGGAAAPGGSSASVQAPQYGEMLSEGVNSALETRRLEKELKAVDAKAASDEASAHLAEKNAELAENNSTAVKKRLGAIEAEAKRDKARADIDAKAAPVDAILDRIDSVLGSASNVMRFKVGRDKNRRSNERHEDERLRRAGRRGIPQ